MKHLKTYENFSYQDFESIDEGLKQWLIGAALSVASLFPVANTIAQDVKSDKAPLEQTISNPQINKADIGYFVVWMLNRGYERYALKNAPTDDANFKMWMDWCQKYGKPATIYKSLQLKGVEAEDIEKYLKSKFGADLDFRQIDRLVGAADDLSARILDRLEGKGKTRDYLRSGEMTDVNEVTEDGKQIVEDLFNKYQKNESIGYRYKKFNRY